MKSSITLETKEVRTILAAFFGLSIESVIPNRYTFGITGLREEDVQVKLDEARQTAERAETTPKSKD